MLYDAPITFEDFMRPFIPALFLCFSGITGCGGKGEGAEPGDCINGLDDDENGLFDCADPGCLNAPDCQETADSASVPEASDTGNTAGGNASGGDGSGGDTSAGSGDGSGGADSSGDAGSGAGGDAGGEAGGETGTGSSDGGDGTGDATGSDGDGLDGEALYIEHCEVCHGPEGQGADGNPPLDHAMTDHTDAEVLNWILNGKGTMPPTAITEAEAEAIIEYLNGIFD